MTTPLIEAIARAIRDFPMAQRLSAATAMKVVEDLRIAGYAIVPVEPTEAMEEAARDVPFIAMGNGEYLEPDRIDIYRAMINAVTHCNNNGKAE